MIQRADLSHFRGRFTRARNIELGAWFRQRPIVPDSVMYESFAGSGMLCNPEAIFRELLAADDMQHLQHVWVLSEGEGRATTAAEFRGTANVRFVKPNSYAYHKAMATSQFLINNSTFPAHYGKRPGQTYVNTWHGTPLKHMGYDMPGGGAVSGNIVRNFAAADFLVSSSPFMTDEMYASAYRLEGFFQGEVLETGQPRVDRQFLSDSETKSIRRDLMSSGVDVGNRKIALYAPTWRGESFHDTDDQSAELARFHRHLESQIDTDEWCVLLKVHQAAYQAAARTGLLTSALVPNTIPTNRLLGITDALITDYSSIFFDYLATGKPVLFYIPDYDEYRDRRGLYSMPEDWPGPISRDISLLAAQIQAIGTGSSNDPIVSHRERYEVAVETYCPYEDGESSKRVVDAVFRGSRKQVRTRSLATDDRKSILINLGGLAPNGITVSGINLLHHIDYDRFDVSVFYRSPRGPNRNQRVAEIDTRARSLRWIPGVDIGDRRLPAMSGPQRRALLRDTLTEREEAAFHDEWLRCFGDCRFDYVIDFSGYSPFWARLFARPAKAAQKSIWLHNDLAADRQKEIDGVPRHFRRLGQVFAEYRNYDHLVSVSPSLAEINRQKLAQYASSSSFVSAPNTINAERVLRMARACPSTAPDIDSSSDTQGASDSFSAAVTALAHAYDSDAREGGTAPRAIPKRFLAPVPEAVSFVTAGRLSPEKNHERLIRAFGLVHQRDSRTRLIILGQGPLRDHLQDVVADLGLEDSVLLTDFISNPYAVIKCCDCFVMSSEYEGQPMTILEARILGLPVVSTNFGSVRSALPEGAGIVVDQSVEALSEGMLKFVDGLVPNPDPFDWLAYNEHAMAQFYRAIGAES